MLLDAFSSWGSGLKLVLSARWWAPCYWGTRLVLADCSLTVAPAIQSLSLQEQPCQKAALRVAELQLLRTCCLGTRHRSALLGAGGVGGTVVAWVLAAALTSGHPAFRGTFCLLAQGQVALWSRGAEGWEASRECCCMPGLWGGGWGPALSWETPCVVVKMEVLKLDCLPDPQPCPFLAVQLWAGYLTSLSSCPLPPVGDDTTVPS